MAGSPAQISAPEALPPHVGPASRRVRHARWRFAAHGRGAPDGAYARLPAWRSREQWCEQARLAVMVNLAVCRRWHVAPATVLRCAVELAGWADGSTGRHCRPTNDRLAAALGLSVRQCQRARGVLLELGLVVLVVAGKAHVTKVERVGIFWRAGSAQRRLAAEFALCQHRPTYPQDPPPAGRPTRFPVRRVTPPTVSEGEVGNSPDLRVLRGTNRTDERLRRAVRHRARSRPVSPAHIRTQRLVAAVQQRQAWLSGVSPRRLTSLHRFAAQRWTPGDIDEAIDGVLRARSWRVPDHLEQPAAYLAGLLRDVDEHDRPGAAREAYLEELRITNEHAYRVAFGLLPECPHGEPAGAMPHPVTGRQSCPMCRRAKEERS